MLAVGYRGGVAPPCTGIVPKYYFVFHEFMILAPTSEPNAEWWRKWMPASQWIKLLEEWSKELQQENGFIKPDLNVIDEHRFWDYAFEIYYWEHEIEGGRER